MLNAPVPGLKPITFDTEFDDFVLLSLLTIHTKRERNKDAACYGACTSGSRGRWCKYGNNKFIGGQAEKAVKTGCSNYLIHGKLKSM